MEIKLEKVLPADIEKRSFEIIESELARELAPKEKPIIKRVIHATADFEYADLLCFSQNAVDKAISALESGATIITDTNMIKSGINKAALSKLGCRVECYMADEDVAESAAKSGTTRAAAAMDKAFSRIRDPKIFAVGNAPTALVRICELAEKYSDTPEIVIGVPVGFVNVVQSKEVLMSTDIPYIVSKGRKGGSTVAVSIVNALMYMITRK